MLDEIVGGLVSEGDQLPDDVSALECDVDLAGVGRCGGFPREVQVDEVGFIAEDGHGARDDLDGGGACEPLENGEQLVSDGIAWQGGVGIGGILAPREVVGGEPAPQRFRGLVEEGTDEGDGGGGGRGGCVSHAGEALGAGTAEKAQEEQLGLVAGMVGEGDVLDAVLDGDAREELMSNVPGGGLDAFAGSGGGIPDGDGLDAAGEVQAACLVADEGGVLRGLLATELVIEVGDDDGVALFGRETGQGVEKGHGIGPARDGDDEGGTRGEAAWALEGAAEILDEGRHAAWSYTGGGCLGTRRAAGVAGGERGKGALT